MDNLFRHRWIAAIAWLESLPFLKLVLVLTLAETVGEAMLAIPTAIAKFGAVAGVEALLALGLINGLIMGAIAKAAQKDAVRREDMYLALLAIPLLASLFIHSFIVWQYPLGFFAAAWVSAFIFLVPLGLIRQGIFTARTVLELRHDTRTDGRSTFAVKSSGQPTSAQVCLSYGRGAIHLQTSAGMIFNARSLHFASFLLPTHSTRELRVSACRVTAKGKIEGLPAFLEVNSGGETKQIDLSVANGQVLLPLTGKMCSLKIIFTQAVDYKTEQILVQEEVQQPSYPPSDVILSGVA
jgi:hypothetical protein